MHCGKSGRGGGMNRPFLQCKPEGYFLHRVAMHANTGKHCSFNLIQRKKHAHVWAVIECKFEYFVVLSVSSACLICLRMILPLEFDVFISLLLFSKSLII